MKNLRILSAAALPLIAMALPASVVAGPSDAITSRIAVYRELGVAFKNANDELRSGSPNSYAVQYAARQIRTIADRQYGLFPKGTAAGKSKALPVIWENPVAFKKAQDNFTAKATTFVAASNSGNVGKIRLAAKELGGACNACHRQFRRED